MLLWLQVSTTYITITPNLSFSLVDWRFISNFWHRIDTHLPGWALGASDRRFIFHQWHHIDSPSCFRGIFNWLHHIISAQKWQGNLVNKKSISLYFCWIHNSLFFNEFKNRNTRLYMHLNIFLLSFKERCGNQLTMANWIEIFFPLSQRKGFLQDKLPLFL